MKPETKLKKGKWYWINDPGSNMHASYIGKAKCISNKASNDFCGGPCYEFLFHDADYGVTDGYFGMEDIVYEITKNDATPTDESARINSLEKRISNLEKLIKQVDK